jgi:predicted DNA-binding transcriptional regulator AlpA
MNLSNLGAGTAPGAYTAPGAVSDEHYVGSVETRKFCGGVSDMTLHRWLKGLPDFPKPVYINGRRYWRLGDLRAFMARRRTPEVA